MGKLNLQKVVIGGLIAGVVLNVVDFLVYGMMLKAPMAAAMQALGKPPIADSMIPFFVVLDFISGIFLVWLYAAVRPRFGAGPGTAVKAGVAAWFIGSFLVNAGMWPMALFPHTMMLEMTAISLIEWPLACVIGAKFYMEGAGMGAGMAGAGAGMGARM